MIEGRARADQTSRKARELTHDPNAVVPVLIHGDAAFPGQGIVAETLNLQALHGYTTGGTVHVIANNQLGFTTDPDESRSTRYASDLAKGFDVPIIHVNADDVEACISAVRLATAFRQTFGRDALIDLIGYRRFGHNETDEPAYTQPQMYERIKKHPPVRKLYAEQLGARASSAPRSADRMAEEAYAKVGDAHTELKESMGGPPETGQNELDRTMSREPRTTVAEDTLRSLNEQLLRVPDGFTVHRKLKPFLERRRAVFEEGATVDWAHAEALAFASLLALGVPVRLTGPGHRARHLQPAPRGAARRRDRRALGAAAAPARRQRAVRAPQQPAVRAGLRRLRVRLLGAGARRARAVGGPVRRLRQLGAGDRSTSSSSPASPSGARRRGSRCCCRTATRAPAPSTRAPGSSASCRPAAEGNIRVANCTTPAQYFHLLRRQALVSKPRPLVVMTPKSLLRLPAATSTLEELAEGSFQRVIDDPRFSDRLTASASRSSCSARARSTTTSPRTRSATQASHIAVARVELLYPFPETELIELIESYPNLERVVWVQEEPRNMGARAFMRRRMAGILPERLSYDYVGRQLRAAPGEGYSAAHKREQARIVRVALDLEHDKLEPDSSAQRPTM